LFIFILLTKSLYKNSPFTVIKCLPFYIIQNIDLYVFQCLKRLVAGTNS
jgi:hypothetical protein